MHSHAMIGLWSEHSVRHVAGTRHRTMPWLWLSHPESCFSFLTGQVSSVGAKTDSSTALMWGALLMLGYLGFDGFTSTFQDSLFKGFSMSTYNQMLYVNAFSSLVSLLGETASCACLSS